MLGYETMPDKKSVIRCESSGTSAIVQIGSTMESKIIIRQASDEQALRGHIAPLQSLNRGTNVLASQIDDAQLAIHRGH